jgi:hypothetical protein
MKTRVAEGLVVVAFRGRARSGVTEGFIRRGCERVVRQCKKVDENATVTRLVSGGRRIDKL